MGEYFLFGTYGGGVYMYKQDTIKKMPLDPSGYLKYVHCFIEDEQHNIWASSNKGLFKSPIQSLIDFWNFGPGNIKFKYFGKADLDFTGVAKLRELITNTGAVSDLEKLITELSDTAQKAINHEVITNEYQNLLTDLAIVATQRSY